MLDLAPRERRHNDKVTVTFDAADLEAAVAYLTSLTKGAEAEASRMNETTAAEHAVATAKSFADLKMPAEALSIVLGADFKWTFSLLKSMHRHHRRTHPAPAAVARQVHRPSRAPRARSSRRARVVARVVAKTTASTGDPDPAEPPGSRVVVTHEPDPVVADRLAELLLGMLEAS